MNLGHIRDDPGYLTYCDTRELTGFFFFLYQLFRLFLWISIFSHVLCFLPVNLSSADLSLMGDFSRCNLWIYPLLFILSFLLLSIYLRGVNMHKDLCTNVHSHIIHNSSKLK